MKTKDFLKKHSACTRGAKWALAIGDDMADVWDALIEQGRRDWLLWTATRPGVFSDAVLRKLACRFIRETPLSDGRKVWDLLPDKRSRNAVEVAEAYADGKATDGELQAAYAAAYAAARASCAAARAACATAYAAAYAAADDVDYAACAAAYAAADNAAYAASDDAAEAALAAADAAQVRMIAELGNPFKQDNPIPYI
jgi:hypothetical protein